MTVAVHHHMAVEQRADITVGRSRNGGPGFVVELDTAEVEVTVFMTREQLLALHAASSIALSRPIESPIGSERHGN